MACIPEGVQSFILSRIEEGFDSEEQIIDAAAEHRLEQAGYPGRCVEVHGLQGRRRR